MNTETGRVPDGTGLSQAEPQEGLGRSGFDPSRDGLEMVARALWLAAASCRDKEGVWLRLSDNDRWPYIRGAYAAIAALRAMGAVKAGAWCFHAARVAQVAKQRAVWALGGKDFHLGDDEIFVACLDAIASRDTDGSPEGPDRHGLDGEAATAGAEGIARGPLA